VNRLKQLFFVCLDEFGGIFYRKYWNIIGAYVCAAISQFFIQNWVLAGMNSNIITLIPKVDNVNRSSDFRHIVLANFWFKIISEVLPERLVSITSTVISIDQNGLVNFVFQQQKNVFNSYYKKKLITRILVLKSSIWNRVSYTIPCHKVITCLDMSDILQDAY